MIEKSDVRSRKLCKILIFECSVSYYNEMNDTCNPFLSFRVDLKRFELVLEICYEKMYGFLMVQFHLEGDS